MAANNVKLAIKILGELGIPQEGLESNMELAKMPEDGTKIFDLISLAVENHAKEHSDEIKLDKPTIEGESKKIYKWNKLALVELKPTMYSFTYNRYGSVEGTDLLRLKFWKLFGSAINNTILHHYSLKKRENADSLIQNFVEGKILRVDYPLLSNFLGTVAINGKNYAITKYEDSIPPLEIVWKRYLVGTMKHNLKQVDRMQTKNGGLILYEGRFPNAFVRFDWRNPLPHKDECVPDEFADFYINAGNARKTAKIVSHVIDNLLKEKGYELVDICYFMNREGNIICSEITPDGMRIRKNNDSFDKDLWRLGKDRDTIIRTWTMLYDDLKKPGK